MRRTFVRTFLVAALMLAMAAGAVIVGPQRAMAQPADDARSQDVRKLLDLMGAAKLAQQTMKQMLDQFRKAAPNVPPEFWDEFEKGIKTDELIDLMVPIYTKHLDAQEVKDLIAFYESPAGKKYTEVQPAILQESMAVGQQWGQQVAQKALAKLKEKGVQPGQ